MQKVVAESKNSKYVLNTHMRNRLITSDILDRFYYDPTSPSGLRWKNVDSVKSRITVGEVAGCLESKRKRFVVGVGNCTYFTHRIVYLLHNSNFDQSLEIDHIDNNTSHNNIENLRPANRSQNRCNTRRPKSNTSGYKHITVYTDKRNGKHNIRYRVAVQKDHKTYKMIFPYTEQGLQEAIAFRDSIVATHHQEFAKIESENAGISEDQPKIQNKRK